MKNAVHQQTTEGEEAITSRECQCCWRAEGDSELRATLTLQREWRKMAARVSEWMTDFMNYYDRFPEMTEEHLELVSCRPAVLTHIYHDTTHYTINGLSPYVPTHVDLSSVTSCS